MPDSETFLLEFVFLLLPNSLKNTNTSTNTNTNDNNNHNPNPNQANIKIRQPVIKLAVAGPYLAIQGCLSCEANLTTFMDISLGLRTFVKSRLIHHAVIPLIWCLCDLLLYRASSWGERIWKSLSPFSPFFFPFHSWPLPCLSVLPFFFPFHPLPFPNGLWVCLFNHFVTFSFKGRMQKLCPCQQLYLKACSK